ncbi:MAG: lysyl oxidase family protein [Nocardioidaceae bacterium]
MRPTLPALAAALASTLAGGLVALAPVGASAADTTPSPLVLTAPASTTLDAYGRRVYLDLGAALEAPTGSFELWSHRSDYTQQITTVWEHGDQSSTLPAGTMKNFAGLAKFLHVQIVDRTGAVAYERDVRTCLNGDAVRVQPDGAAHSPYPYGCPWNPFTVGSVQGIASGWAVRLSTGFRGVKLPSGRYDVTLSINPAYRTLFGIADADGTRTVQVRVVRHTHGGQQSTATTTPHARRTTSAAVSPRGSAPTGRHLTAAPAGPVPDLASLPAFGIGISHDGNHLQFAATVWNAGSSPLVVDGFRRTGEDLMDAYQYFYDADGNQTGYTPVGGMEWDPRPTHQHWHFQDFARYRLLDASQTGVRRSKKEAFCLANTDAVDFTVPFANWNPDNTDLHTACGDHSALAVREVLETGSGDTYAQYRAGQSFSLEGLPNGSYYISVEANPDGRLVEADSANNVALREVTIGGTDGARTVSALPVGRIHAH